MQPISIRTEPTLNTVNLSIEVQDTISQEGIQGSETPIEIIERLSDDQNQAAEINIQDQPRNSSNIVQVQNDIDSLNANFDDIITDQEQASDFANLIQQADRLSQNYVEDAAETVSVLNDINRYVGTSTARVSDRLRAMRNSTSALFTSLPTVPSIELLSFAGFGAMANATSVANIAANPTDDDYITVSDVLEVKDEIADYWNETVDQFSNYGSDSGRVGKEIYELPELPTRLAFDAINACLGNLNEIAFSARIEADYLVESDTNVINLTYKLYGSLGAADENINEVITINELGPNQILLIKSGTIIKYLL